MGVGEPWVRIHGRFLLCRLSASEPRAVQAAVPFFPTTISLGSFPNTSDGNTST